MDKDSNTILLFTEQRTAFEYLSDEDAGRMIKAIYAYSDEGTIPNFEGAMMSLFSLVRSQIDRSREAYQKKCDQNRRNSRKRKNMQGESDEPSTDNENDPSLSTDNERCQPTTNVILPNPNRNPNPKPDIDDGANTHIINGDVVVEGEEYPFDEVWNMYGKFVGDVEALRKRWNELSADEKRNIFNYVPFYVQSRPEKKYRKDFANFLTCRTWETEPINQLNTSNGSNNQYGTSSNGTRRTIAQQNTMQLVSKFLTGEEEPVVSFSESEG
jgi:hypothetical protein